MARSIGVFFLLSLPLSLCLRITSPMAPACRILTSPMAAAEPYEGAGSNRKIRRRPLRRPAETPYDRPAAAIQGLRIQSAAAVAERNGWISKIFQPAMRIIARSASHIFPSMFQTPLPPPSVAAAGMTDPCTDENHHSCKGFSEVACTNPSPKVWEPCSSDAVNLVNNSSPDGAQRILNSDGNGISELEILLKQKTFTRSEFDRLTELLRSRTIEPSSWQPTVIYEKGEANVSGQENENDTRSNGNIPTPALSLRNQLFREDALPSIIPYGRQISQISTASKFVTHFSGISEAHQNGHMLPRPIGRTAMHRMARSPYFKAASATNIMVHDLGSPGPIRRLRQKSNLISLSKDIQWPHGNRLPEDNKVPNGKEKTCQSTITYRDDLPSKLTTSMLQGRALKSMEDIDWPKFLNLKGKDKLDTPTDSHVQKPESSISLKQGKIANTVESCPSISGVKVIETVGAVSGSVAVSSGKRAPFRMSPPEDDFDLGDDDSSQTKLNTEAVMKASATKGVVEFSFPVAPACSSFSLPPPAPTMPSPLLERSSLQEEQIIAPSQTKSNTEAVMKASDKSATKGDFEFSFPVAPACSSFSLAPTMPFGFKFNARNSTTTALPGSSYPVNDRKSLEAGDLFETSVIATSSCLPTSGPAVIGTLSPSSDSFSTSAPSVAPSTSMSNAQIVTSATPWFELGSLLSTAIKRSSSTEFKVMPEEASSVSTSSAISSLTSTAMCSNSNPVLVTSAMFSSTTLALSTTSSLSASPFGFTSPAQPSTTTLPVADGSSKTSLGIFGTTPGSIFGSQATVVGVGSSPFSLTAESQFGSSTSVTGSLFEASDSQMSSNDFGAKPFGSTVLSFTSSYFSSPTAAASLSTFNSQKSAPSIFSFSASSPFIASSSASTGFTSSALGFGSSFFAAAGSQTLTHSIFDHMDVDEGSMADDSIPAAASTIPEARFSFGSSSQPSASAEQMEIDSCTIQSEPKYDPRLFEDLRRLPQCLCDPMIDGSIQAAPSTIPPARFSLGSTSQPSTSADKMEIDGPTMEEMMALALTRLGEDPRQKRFNDFVKLYPFYFADEIWATPSVLSRMRELSDARSSRFTGPSLTASCSPLEQGLESDLFLLQCCAALAPLKLFVKRIQERFGLFGYTSLNLADYTRYESVIVQEMLTLIIQIVQEGRYCGFSATENLRRELVYMLAVGDSTRSQLVKSLPRKNGGQLQNVLNMLAVYSNPFGLNQGKYSLRKAHWKELDLYHPRWTSRDLQLAEERYLRFCKVSAADVPRPRWTRIFEHLNQVSRIATSKTVLQIVCAVLFYAVFAERLSISCAPDGVLITALHLLSVTLDICQKQNKIYNKRFGASFWIPHMDERPRVGILQNAENSLPTLAFVSEEFIFH